MHTLDAPRGKFARVCIDIDLDKPVVGTVWFRDFWYHVEYEGLHLLCKNCGIYGHVARNCQSSARQGNNDGETESSEKERSEAAPISTTQNKESTIVAADCKEEGLYGDWLVVTKKKNQGSKTVGKNHGNSTKSVGGSNKKSNDRVSFFAPLKNAGLHLTEENVNLNETPQFHIGGGWIALKCGQKEIKGPAAWKTNPKSPIKLS
jgi:hypothetical protein